MDFFAGYGGGAGGILPRRACPCEYVARRPPHRRWVQETQPHTCGCAERILTAEFQPNSNSGVLFEDGQELVLTLEQAVQESSARADAFDGLADLAGGLRKSVIRVGEECLDLCGLGLGGEARDGVAVRLTQE